MEKIKRIVSSRKQHGESANHGGNTTGNAGTTTSSVGYPRDTAASTNIAPGYSKAGNTDVGDMPASHPQGGAAAPNTFSSYANTGNMTAGQAKTDYPTSLGYGNIGNTAAGEPGTVYTSDATRTGLSGSQYNAPGSNKAGDKFSDYKTTGNFAAQGNITGQTTAVSDEQRRLSKGPNEGTGITSGLGSLTTAEPGNIAVEDGLTRGFQPTTGTGGASGASNPQYGSTTGRDFGSTSTGYPNTASTAASGQHLGRDNAAIGTEEAAAEGTHLHRQTVRDTPGSGTGYSAPSTSDRLGQNVVASGTSGQGSHLHRQTGHENLGLDGRNTATSADPSSGHRLERDAAILGSTGTGAADAKAYYAHENKGEGISSTAGYAGNASSETSGAYPGPYGTAVPGPHATNAANILDPAVNTSGQNLGRDAAIGAGVGTVAGSTGLAEHEHRKHETGTGNRARTTTGTDSGAKTSQTSGNDPTTTSTPGHHLGRDTAIGAAGVGVVGLGAAGLGAGEHESRENEYEKASGGYGGSTGIAGSQAGKSATQRATDDSALPGPAPHTAGPHRYDWLNKLDPRVNANPDMTTSPTAEGKSGTAVGGQHYARDAALGAGVGGVGGATYGSARQGHAKKDSGVAGILPTTMNDQKYDTQYTTDQNTSGNTSTREADDKLQGAMGPTRATGPASATGTSGTATKGGVSSSDYNGSGTSTLQDQSTGRHHYGRDAVGAGGTGGVGIAAHELYKHEGLDNSGAGRTQTTSQQRAPALSTPDTYGTSTGAAKERADQQQYGRDAAATSGIGGTEGTSKQQYPNLSSVTPSGIDRGQFGSNVATYSSQYGASTSDPRSIMPGTFPETSTGLDTYDSPMTNTQGGGAAGVGTQGYTTAKHGPNTVTSGERGSNKLHKEPLEQLASAVKRKLAS